MENYFLKIPGAGMDFIDRNNFDVECDYMNWYGIKIGRLQHFIVDSDLDTWLNLLNGKLVFKAK